MRTFFKILGGLAIIGALGAGLGFWLTSGIADTGNRFFSKLREGDAKAAYELTSPGFRTATTLAAFEAYTLFTS